jgi:hypothetical protein
VHGGVGSHEGAHPEPAEPALRGSQCTIEGCGLRGHHPELAEVPLGRARFERDAGHPLPVRRGLREALERLTFWMPRRPGARHLVGGKRVSQRYKIALFGSYKVALCGCPCAGNLLLGVRVETSRWPPPCGTPGLPRTPRTPHL